MVRWLSVVGLVLSLAAASGNASAQGHMPEPGYQDDRSTPEAVIGSYYARYFIRWASSAAAIQQVDNDADTATLMAQSCPPV